MDKTTARKLRKIGFGGSCHWCTEAIFLSLKGVTEVQQGWIASGQLEFSEAVLVTFDTKVIPLERLIEIHLFTHSCTSVHSMRGKYRSAVYYFSAEQRDIAMQTIAKLQIDYDKPIITEVLPYGRFKGNTDQYLNYYYSNPEKPFCKNIIDPKLKTLLERYKADVKPAGNH